MRLPGRALLGRLGWTTAGFGYGQGIRLAGNIVLTRLLAPEVFGIMLIVNTLRTGMELLSDIGVGQNIVVHRRGEESEFLDTAWTLQAIRGIILSVAFGIAAIPLSQVYGDGTLLPILQLSALFLAVSGFQSVGRYVAQRRQEMRRLALFEMGVATAAMGVQIALAWIWPTVWALVVGTIISAALITLASFWIVPGLKLRLRIDRESFRDIVHFGKWIFLSSIVYFVATNFDRLYLGTVVPLAVLGVFGIARGLADVVGNLVTRIGNSVIFPAISAARQDASDIRAKLARVRTPMLLMSGAAIAALIAVSDLLVTTLYDARYLAAAAMLPVLAAGLWFTVLATVGEAVLLGVAKPVYGTVASVAKLGWLIVALPAGVAKSGVAGAIVAIALADFVRYAVTVVGQWREGLSFARQDLGLTIIVVAVIFMFREVSGIIGLTDGWSVWLPALREYLV